MFGIITKIPFFKMFRKLGFPKMMPINYTVSLLYGCNSRCKTCNIYKKNAKQLSIEEYDKIFRNIGKSPYWITFSGGEPFLRKDIVEIVNTIYDRSKPKIINIPTNGILTKKIVSDVQKIARHCRKSSIIINVSIDGIGYQHDDIRNVEGCFEKVTNTFENLKNLKMKNLSVGIHTVVSNFNVNDFARISSMLMAMEPDSYITEIAEQRVELGTMKSNITPSLLKYKSAIDFLIHRIKQSKYTGMQRITQSFRIEYYQLVKSILRDEKQVIPCYSGFASVQISPDGNIWPCCIKAVNTGNLRKNDYNFRKIWNDDKMRIQRKSIHDGECHCPLANASYTNMLMNYNTLIRVFYRSFIKWWT